MHAAVEVDDDDEVVHPRSLEQVVYRWIRGIRIAVAATTLAVLVLSIIVVTSVRGIVREQAEADQLRAVAERKLARVEQQLNQRPLAAPSGKREDRPAITDHRDQLIDRLRVGDTLLERRDLSGALGEYRAALALAEQLAHAQPTELRWQREVWFSWNKIGDGLLAQRDGPGAHAAYDAGLAIAQQLAQADPAAPSAQHDLATSHAKVGHALVAMKDGPGALEAYRAALGILEPLAVDATADRQVTTAVARLQTRIARCCRRL